MRLLSKNTSSLLLALGAALACGTTLGCGHAAIISANALPVQRVVVYRNGVAYFERTGHVDTNEVRFKMRQSEIGDFLATLAVMEVGGSSVRAAAFPLKPEEEPESEDGKPKPLTPDQKAGLESVVLSLDGKDHDLQVGYVTESPVWKPSYRLVVRAGEKADLQAWGIVENLSGEDWKNVHLSLIGGAPLAFRTDLGTPVIPQRPTVTDQGEVIAAVPKGETSLEQEPSEKGSMLADALAEEPPAPPSAAAPRAANAASGAGGALGAMRREAKIAVARPMAAAHAEYAAPAPPPPPQAISAPRNLHSLAAIAAEGGSTRYDLPTTVTIPDKSATMVMLLAEKVPGEAMFLFAPDYAVPDSTSHPFRVARFANSTAGTLDRGPIAVFEAGAFLGQGMIEPLPAGATATVPFALERSVAIDHTRKQDEHSGRVSRIENSDLTLEYDRITRTTYRIRNGSALPVKLAIKHERTSGMQLFEPPPGTEDNVGGNSALVPVSVAVHATTEVGVEERLSERRNVMWFAPAAAVAVKLLLADPTTNQDVVKKLSAAWAVHEESVAKRAERDKLQTESNTLARSTEETRRNLAAIEKNKTADALRQKLTKRLADTSAHLETLNRQIVELDASLAELGVQWNESIREVHYSAPAISTPHS